MIFLWVPLIAAVAFAAGSLMFKRAFAEGAGVAHAVIFNNIALAFVFLPLLAVESRPIPWQHIHLPFVVAAAFVTGHLLNILSFLP